MRRPAHEKSLTPKPPFSVLVMMHKDRLGHEQYETSYYLKKLDQVGVRIVEHLTGRECKLETTTDRTMEFFGDFAATQERHMASLRTRDALKRKVEHGFVAGGTVFGYWNVGVFGERLDATGQPTRQHVTREIAHEEESPTVDLFELAAQDLGDRRIAKRLNEEVAPAPRPRRTGRPLLDAVPRARRAHEPDLSRRGPLGPGQENAGCGVKS